MGHPHYTLTHTFRRVSSLQGAASGLGSVAAALFAMRELGAASPGLGSVAAALEVSYPTVYHIIIVGQSNGQADGAITQPIVRATAPKGYMFTNGLRPGSSGLSALVAMQETPSQTMAAPMAHWLATAEALTIGQGLIVVSNVAVSAMGYNSLKKGTTPYNDSIAQVTALKTIADNMSLPYKVMGLCCVHGEFDDQFSRADYRAELATWQSDYDGDIRAITGQSEIVRLYAPAQFSAVPEQYNSGSPTLAGASALNLLLASQDAPGLVIHVGSECVCDYLDGIHFNAGGQVLLGEKIAAIMAAAFFRGELFQPLHITAAALAGNQITLDYHVPVGALAFNDRFTGHRLLRGFEFYDDAGPSVSVISVAITGPAQVTLTLSGPPTGGTRQVRYMCNQGGAGPNQRWARAGNLCDSAATASLNLPGLVVPNFAVSQLFAL